MKTVKYESGKYSRLVGKGKTREEAIANLESKKLQKQKKDYLNQFTSQEINALYSALECAICNEEEFNNEFALLSSVWGYKTYQAIEDTLIRLHRLSVILEKIEGNKNDWTKIYSKRYR